MARSFVDLPSFADLEDRLRSAPDPERLARSFVACYWRARARPMTPKAIYRYPRGRRTDRIPLSPVLLAQ